MTQLRFKTYRIIGSGILCGAYVKIIAKTKMGYSVQFLEDFAPYKKGERVCLDKYEIEPVNTLEKFNPKL